MSQKIKTFTIDLRKASEYVDGEHDIMIQSALTKKGLFADSFLYTVLNGSNLCIEHLKKHGTYRKDDTIFAFTSDQLNWDNDTSNCIGVFVKKEYTQPALAVWNRFYFETPKCPMSDYHYKFKDPQKKLEALVGIARLKI